MSFELSLYFEATGIGSLSDAPVRRHLEEYMEHSGIRKVYLEIFRGDDPRSSGVCNQGDVIRKWKSYFEKRGLKVAAGEIYGAWSPGYGDQMITLEGKPVEGTCFSGRETREYYRDLTGEIASIFDELLFDDWFCTRCFCERCIGIFNERYGHDLSRERIRRAFLCEDEALISQWMDHSYTLLSEMAEIILETARKTNPDIEINWKVHESSDDYYYCGMYLEKMKDLFDCFYVGTESRDRERQYPYGSYFNYWYVKSLVGNKLRGAWVDSLGGLDWNVPVDPEVFIDQLWMSILTGAKEVVLFSFPGLLSPSRREHRELLLRELPEMKAIHREIKNQEPKGICMRKPRAPQALYCSENYIHDLMGMVGIPIKPVNEKSHADESIEFVSLHSADLNHTDSLEKGKTLVFSSEAITRLVSRGKVDMLGLSRERPIEKDVVMCHAFKSKDGELLDTVDYGRLKRGFHQVPAGPVLRPGNGETIVSAMDAEGSEYSLILVNRYSNGTVWLYPLTKFPHYLPPGESCYAEFLRQLLRDVIGEAIGVKLRGLISKIGLFPCGEKVVLRNFNRFPVHFSLCLKRKEWREVEVRLEPRESRLYNTLRSDAGM